MTKTGLFSRLTDPRGPAWACGGVVAALGFALVGAPALAQPVATAPVDLPAPPAPPPSPSDSLALNLVRLLVKQGVISQAAADGLVSEAQRETAVAQASNVQTLPGSAVGAPYGGAMANLPPPAPGVVRVPYVPQIVRDQIRDEVKAEVLAQAKAENWAQPNAIPDWINRIHWSGDLRFRDQGNLFDKNNTNEFLDFATFNANGPTDINPNTNPNGLPFLNTRRDRNNTLSIRARLALDAQLSDHVSVGVRLATGDNPGPVSTTSTLGGGFNKKNIYLDRAFITVTPRDWASATFGRMPNPFFSTDLVYDEDLNFDGVAATFKSAYLARYDVGLSITGGAFPIDYQNQNFPTNDTNKGGDNSKYLLAGQVVADWARTDFDLKAGLAYYDFSGTRGQLSAPCALYNGNKQCSTDFTRPPFMQKGNTLFFVRNILPNPASPLDFAEPQYLGQTFDYRLLDLTAALDYRIGYSHHLLITGNFVRNLAYNSSDICRNAPLGLPVNNLTASAAGNTNPCATPAVGDTKARFQSGPNAWMIRAVYGDITPLRFGEWNVTAGYKYIEPDAVEDGFNDNDFHLGGTNAEGYFIAVAFGLYSNTFVQARYFSANEIYGPPLSIDVGQLDLNVKF